MLLLDTTPKEKQVWELIADTLASLGLAPVRVKLSVGARTPTLQIMIERTDDQMVGIEDCEAVSRQLSVLFDVHDPVKGAYQLEVSSPGMDRPLVQLEDFERFKDHLIAVKTSVPIDAGEHRRKKFKGMIEALNEENLTLKTHEFEDVITIRFDEIQSAKLVIEDDSTLTRKKETL